MARPVQIKFPGAVYHVICRGNNQVVFRDDHDRTRYLEKLSLYCEEKEVELLAYCLLANHVHLVLETPKGNLSKMMQPFQTSYTVGRSPAVKSAREMICYVVVRRHSDVGLQELTHLLRVKELSTVSQGVRRAERRLSAEPDFHRQLERVLKILSRSSIQA